MTIVRTVEKGPRIYAGSRYFFKEWPMRSKGGISTGHMFAFFFNFLGPFDLPLSFVLDTMMLPVTVVAEIVD